MNIVEVILSNSKKNPNKNVLNYKSDGVWKAYSWKEFDDTVRKTACALLELGVKEGDRISIYADNIPEWIIFDLAGVYLGAAVVPIFSTLTSIQAEYILKDSGSSVILVGNKNQYDNILQVKKNLPKLKNIVIVDKIDIKDENFFIFSDFIKDKSTDVPICNIEDDDVITITYTSGTTGNPKGVLLTNYNFSQAAICHQEYLSRNLNEYNELVFLPLSHIFEKGWCFCLLYYGGQLSFCKNPKEVENYLVEVKPSSMCSIPRLFEKI